MIRGVAERGDSFEDGTSPLSSDATQAGKRVRYRRRRHARSDCDIADRRRARRCFRRFSVLHSANYLLSNSQPPASSSTRPKAFKSRPDSKFANMVLFEPCSEDNYKTVLALGATFTTPAVVKSDPAAKVKLGEQTAAVRLEYGAILLFRQDYPLSALCR